MLSRIVLRSGRLSADILKKFIVHFKQLRCLELSDGVFLSDFALWEVLGALPSLTHLTLSANGINPDPVHVTVPENSNSDWQSGGPKYFEALKGLCVTGPFFLILGFIDSPCLKSIEVYPVINPVLNEHDHEDKDLFISSMTVVASKWSQSLKNLVIGSNSSGILLRNSDVISKCLILLMDLHEIQTFHLIGWRMENMDDDVRRLVKSWPKLMTLKMIPFNETYISLSTLRIIAENCPELRHLEIQLDTSTIPSFETSSKSLHHNLEFLAVGRHKDPNNTITQTKLRLQRQIQVTRYLDLLFPYLKCVLESELDDEFWLGIRDLVELCQDARRVK